MSDKSLIENIKNKLLERGYQDRLILREGQLCIPEKPICFGPDSTLFVDAIYHIEDEGRYLLAIAAPAAKLKAVMDVDFDIWDRLRGGDYAELVNVTVQSLSSMDEAFTIRRQYGMRKILADTFDVERYEWREGFPDFPACPYDHAYRGLGYDLQEKEYVRLAPSILKRKDLKRRSFE